MPVSEHRHSNGLLFLTLSTRSADADVFLQGAHLTRFQPMDGSNLLWVSDAEDYQPGKPIRGGIPVCWPWFGAHPDHSEAPAHGLVRNRDWHWQVVKDTPDHCHIYLLTQTTGDHPAFPHKAELRLDVKLDTTLRLSLTTTNLSDSAFVLSQALHSYFAVADIDQAMISGLEGYPYYDKVTSERAIWPEKFAIDREIDRIVQDSGQPLTLNQPNAPGILLERSGSESVVIWNPWREKSKSLSNFKDDDYRHMLCIESANADQDSRLIAPEDTHTLKTTISAVHRPV